MFVFFFFFYYYSWFDIGSRESKSIQANAVGGPTNHPSAPSITLSLLSFFPQLSLFPLFFFLVSKPATLFHHFFPPPLPFFSLSLFPLFSL